MLDLGHFLLFFESLVEGIEAFLHIGRHWVSALKAEWVLVGWCVLWLLWVSVVVEKLVVLCLLLLAVWGWPLHKLFLTVLALEVAMIVLFPLVVGRSVTIWAWLKINLFFMINFLNFLRSKQIHTEHCGSLYCLHPCVVLVSCACVVSLRATYYIPIGGTFGT